LAIDGLPSRSVLLNNRVARRKRRQSPLRLVKVVAWEESDVVGEVEDGAVTMGAEKVRQKPQEFVDLRY
jgi:hypothetical protein